MEGPKSDADRPKKQIENRKNRMMDDEKEKQPVDVQTRKNDIGCDGGRQGIGPQQTKKTEKERGT